MKAIAVSKRMRLNTLILTLGLLLASPVLAQGAKVSSPVELARRAEALKPGQWVWAPKIAPAGPMLVYVDLSRQLATIYRNGVRIGVATVSTGKPGHETPTGVFTILEKNVEHHSNVYNSASMPYQQRLTWSGVALHAGGLPGYPESHGCVHLPYAFARELFAATKRGTTVVVTGDASHPVNADGGEVLAPAVVNSEASGEFWEPARAKSGPVTIVMSRSDQMAVVLRNGVEIGRSRATLPADNDSSHVLTLGAGTGGKPVWFYVGVAGHTNESGQPVNEATRNRVQVPPGFYAKVMPILTPGTTLLVTAAPLSQGATGMPLTVLNGSQ